MLTSISYFVSVCVYLCVPVYVCFYYSLGGLCLPHWLWLHELLS